MVEFIDLGAQQQRIHQGLEKRIKAVLAHGNTSWDLRSRNWKKSWPLLPA
jgi:hypothetical protein